MNMYGINKQIMSQVNPLEKDLLQQEIGNVSAWFGSKIENKYFMLLCNERKDYTIFNTEQHNYAYAASELLACLEERGNVLSIDYDHEFHYYEIWVRDDTDTYMYLLFPCNDFVIEC